MRRCIDEALGELITHYEMGQLTDEERDRFEEHVMDCDFCRQELEQMARIASTLDRHQVTILESLKREGINFESLKRELSVSHRPSRSLFEILLNAVAYIFRNLRRPRVFVPAVSIAIAVFVLILLHPSPFAENPYLAYLSFEKLPYQALELRGQTTTEADEFFDRGMKDYLASNYQGAIGKLREAVERAPDNGNWWLYLGICYYLDHQSTPAIEALTKADTLTRSLFKIRARWYLAQSHLLNRDSDRAISLLEWIVAQNKTYADRADSLLRIVQSIRQRE